MKKHMILAAVAALTLASCAKIDTFETKPVVDENVPIGFTNYAPKSLTKAGDTYVAGNDLVTGKHFAVYAWSTANGSYLTANPGTPNFMNPADVTYTGDTMTGENNTYTPTRFWPSGDTPDNLSFTAYYPYGGAGITAPTFTTGVGTYAFEAQAAAADMVDFCVADVVNDQVYGNTNAGSSYKQTVSFTFKHQLTKVQFKFKKATGLGATTVIELLDAELVGIQKTGTLTATYTRNASPAVNALGTTATAWSNQGGSQGYEIFVNSGDNKVNPEYTAPSTISNPVTLADNATTTVDNSAIFLMVPQTMADNTQKLSVTWRVRVYDDATNAGNNNGTGLLSETINTKTLDFYDDLTMETWDDPDDSTDELVERSHNWVKNQFVTYTVTIGPKPIWFTGTVASWDAEQNGFFSVQ